ncbi:RNA polymerase sigma-I factor [Halalkalibacter urbisdiaboli]|uniref:RNA polymerase sigma-I factor n=1 Tax=Halalkalibacter urbisdiaboli TaxID=1960589 RepID=UPI000B438195|nr:RNA polymerase sigma-I factor [Halalkalibacter urbisdiaboli]
MNSDEQKELILAKSGDELARERMIRHYKPYIINATGHISKRYITWSDEEASIALLAFNRAIDTFDDNGGRQFLSYAYLLMNRDLIDYFRKEKREKHLSLNLLAGEEETAATEQEFKTSVAHFQKQVRSMEIVEEILELDEALRPYKISFEELEDHSPKHRDSRMHLFEVASNIAADSECMTQLQRKKKLPISAISKKMGYNKKLLERHRKYLITLILLEINPHWEQLSQFIRKEEGH